MPRWSAQAPADYSLLTRTLKRVIQREVQDPLALALLHGEFKEGDTVRVDARDGAVVFEK